jgi:hypothetical protein
MTKNLLKLLLVLGVLLVTLPANGAVVGYRTGVFLGPAYGPWVYGYGPYYYGGYPIILHPNAGQVKIDTKLKDAQVFINGAYAGTVKEMKSMWLHQGTYKMEVRAPGGEIFATQIYVVNGKTVHVHPDLPTGGKS